MARMPEATCPRTRSPARKIEIRIKPLHRVDMAFNLTTESQHSVRYDVYDKVVYTNTNELTR